MCVLSVEWVPFGMCVCIYTRLHGMRKCVPSERNFAFGPSWKLLVGVYQVNAILRLDQVGSFLSECTK